MEYWIHFPYYVYARNSSLLQLIKRIDAHSANICRIKGHNNMGIITSPKRTREPSRRQVEVNIKAITCESRAWLRTYQQGGANFVHCHAIIVYSGETIITHSVEETGFLFGKKLFIFDVAWTECFLNLHICPNTVKDFFTDILANIIHLTSPPTP